MKKITMIFSLLAVLASAGAASAREVVVVGPGPGIAAVVAPFPEVRVIVGRPGIYCWYQGRYYSRPAWDRYCRFHPARYAYRYHRNHGWY